MTLAPPPVIGSTLEDTLLAALDSLLAQSDAWAVAEGHIASLGRQCAADGFRASLARFRADGRILSRFLGQGGLARKRQHLGPSLRCYPLLVESPVHPQSAHWASSCNVVSSILTPLGRSRRVSRTPRHTREETASERRRRESRAVVCYTWCPLRHLCRNIA
jgi:hypothetical protein